MGVENCLHHTRNAPEWSQCSCVSRMPSISRGLTPHCASRNAICRELNPPSTSNRVCGVSTSAQLPALPLPRIVTENICPIEHQTRSAGNSQTHSRKYFVARRKGFLVSGFWFLVFP